MDAVAGDSQSPTPKTLLYIRDVILASEDKDDLEQQVHSQSAVYAVRLRAQSLEGRHMAIDVNHIYLTISQGPTSSSTLTQPFNGMDKVLADSFKSKVYRGVSEQLHCTVQGWSATNGVEPRLSVMVMNMLR